MLDHQEKPRPADRGIPIRAKPGRQSAWRALDRRAVEVVPPNGLAARCRVRVFAKEHEQAAKLSALGNAVDHTIE